MKQATDPMHESPPNRGPARGQLLTGAVAAVVGSLVLSSAGPAQAASVAVPLGSADSFVVLAGAGTTNTGLTRLGGDIGTYPTPAMTGMGGSPADPDRVVFTGGGVDHAGDNVTQGAKTALLAAYGNAKQQASTETISADLGGQRLTRGVYTSGSTMGLTGPLTLDAEGDPDAVFVFQVGSSLTTATSSSVLLIGEAQACNVFWQVEEDASLGTTSSFVGTLMVENSVTLGTNAEVLGRVLASDGSVTMDTNTITRPECDTPPDDDGTPEEDDEDAPGAEDTPDDSPDGDGRTPRNDEPTTRDDTPRDGQTPPTTPTPVVDTPQVRQIPSGAVDTGARGGTR